MKPIRLGAIALVLAACSQTNPGPGTAPSTTTAAPTSSTTSTETPSPTTTVTGRTSTSTSSPSTTTPTSPPALVPPSVPPGGTICDVYGEPDVRGRVSDTRLIEISGIASSRTHDGIIWAVNDSGDAPVVYGLEGGDTVAVISLNAVFPIDWEDLDIGPGPDGTDHLFVADIGDNLGFRPWISIFRLPEPDPATGDAAADADELELVYPDLDAVDAETLAVDPITGDLLVIPKSKGEVGVYRVTSGALGGRTTMERIATLDLGAEITAASFSPSGDRLVLRGYRTIWIWPRTEVDITELFGASPCEPPSARERQGEALTVSPDGDLVTISEGGRPDINVVPVEK